jgi:dipeptidyl aminopeptidase/acylaminoacyl peptidase
MLDCLVPYTQSVSLHQALQAKGVDSTLVLIPFGDHGGSVFDMPKYKTMIDEFLDANLKGSIVKKRRAVR